MKYTRKPMNRHTDRVEVALPPGIVVSGEPVSNEAMTLLVLAWAKATKPEAYAKTLRVANIAPTFRAYMLRLVELRWAEDVKWRREVPLSVLEETSLKQRVKFDGKEIEVAGRMVPNRRYSWMALALDAEGLNQTIMLVETFDLELMK